MDAVKIFGQMMEKRIETNPKSAARLMDTAFQFIDDLIVRKLRAAGNGDIEDQICPGVSSHHTEIMDAQCAVKISDDLVSLFLHFQLLFLMDLLNLDYNNMYLYLYLSHKSKVLFLLILL